MILTCASILAQAQPSQTQTPQPLQIPLQPKFETQVIQTPKTLSPIQTISANPLQIQTPAAKSPLSEQIPIQMPVQVQLPVNSIALSSGATQAGQPITAPTAPTPVALQPAPIVVPPGAAYENPTYPSPGEGWSWAYNFRKGWGWHHPEKGWQKGW